ncbi:UDP-2,3-diacylglucosamine diphosphatase [bacterium]|nr:UDP-2,3-diacylglucosamine diphosphatase [bacterium]
MSAIFLSDVHLKDGNSVKTQLVIRFLQQVASGFEQVYILGDLFDVWPGTTAYQLERYKPVLEALGELVRGGHQVHYLEGNHDFRLGEYFRDTLGVKVYPDAIEENWNGRRILMVHGDLANPNEKGAKALRSLLRADLLHFVLTRIPQTWLYGLGRNASRLSRKFQSRVPLDETKVRGIYREAARSYFRNGKDVVIMGHTHLPDHFQENVGERSCDYYNLGDWVRHFTYLEFDGREFYTKTHPVKSL